MKPRSNILLAALTVATLAAALSFGAGRSA